VSWKAVGGEMGGFFERFKAKAQKQKRKSKSAKAKAGSSPALRARSE
jgi:hypothetical protein